MTICVAAISREGDKEYIVFATDHMITTALGQFEHSIIKYKLLNECTVAMLAGDSLLFDDLVKIKDGTATFNQIKLEVFTNFKEKKKEIIENQIFSNYGINQNFFIEALQKEIPNPFIQSILEQVSLFQLDAGILLIGFDNGVARITEIKDTGTLDFRNMNFHAIGTGNIQAANTLLFQKHSKNDKLSSTIYDVYKAKRNAEVSEGVGKETDILILSQQGVKQLSTQQIATLNKIYEEELLYGKNNPALNGIKPS